MHPRDLASLAGEETIFSGVAGDKLKRLQAELKPLSRRFDVVVANPPYMGSKNMNKWLGDWVKKRYKDVKGDLFSCFMVRNVGMGTERAQLGFMTPYVWMFIGTYEKLRKFVIQQNTITSLIQLEYSGFSGATVPICTFTLQKGYCPGYRGGYVRLSDFVGADQQAPRALEALANPDCGWFYRANASGFEAVPGSPIAYWASAALLKSFEKFPPLESFVPPKSGLTTGDNERFLRYWWECSEANQSSTISNRAAARKAKIKWVPCNKGGEYRKWYGNNDYVVNWKDDGDEMKAVGLSATTYRNSSYYFREGITWSSISSSKFHIRYSPQGRIPERKGATAYSNDKKLLFSALATLNSSSCSALFAVLAPTLDYSEGPVGRIPAPANYPQLETVVEIANSNISAARLDWDAFEISHDFKKHPLYR